MGLDPATLPDKLKRLMSPEDRKSLGAGGETFDEAQAQKATRDERELQEQIEAYLRVRNIICNRSRMDKRTTSKVGWPDITFAVNGRASAVEAKMPGRLPTAEQYACMTAMLKNGWRVEIVNNLEQVKRIVDELEAETRPDRP